MELNLKKAASMSIGLAIVSLMASCQRTEWQPDPKEPVKITVDQARAAFESELLDYADADDTDLLGITRKIGEEAQERFLITYDLNPGEFTPEWDRAQVVTNSSVQAVSTPIMQESFYIAVREYEVEEQEIEKTVVRTAQKLVGIAAEDGTISNYILTIAPSEAYYANNKTFGQEFHYGDYPDEFSGLALLHTLDGAFFEVQEYKAGRSVRQLGVTNCGDVVEFLYSLTDLTGDITFIQVPPQITSKFEWWEDDGELLAYWYNDTWSVGTARNIARCLGNGYYSTCNIRDFYGGSTSAGRTNFSVTNRGATYMVTSMGVGSNPGTYYSTQIWGSAPRTVADPVTGQSIPATAYYYRPSPNSPASTQIEIVVPNSDRDKFYDAGGYYNGINPPK